MSWQVQTLPDGRVVEFVSAHAAPAEPDDPEGTLSVEVVHTIDGAVGSTRVLLTAAQVEAAFAGRAALPEETKP